MYLYWYSKEKFRHVWFDSIVYTDLYTYFENRKADYHYFEIRKTLIDHLKIIDSPVIVNIDDFYTSEIEHSMLVGYGLYGDCNVTARKIELLPDGSKLLLVTDKGSYPIELKVPGIHNVYNALAAVAWGIAHKLDLESIIKGVESFKGIPNIEPEIHASDKVTIDYIEPTGISQLEEFYNSIKDVAKDKLATILCIGDNFDEQILSAIKPILIENSGLCTITCDYLSSPNKMEKLVPICLEELKDIGAKYSLDHYKALQKIIARLKDGGHIIIVSGKRYNVSEKE